MYDHRFEFSVCSFMDDAYILGEFFGFNEGLSNSCVKYSIKNHNWNKVARMHEGRECSVFTVFEGKVVVSGGKSNN